MGEQQEPKVLTTPQVAKLLGWSVGYVRKGMARNGISEVRGWPEDKVRQLADQIGERQGTSAGLNERTGGQ